ncbi:MAG: alpha-galactosidase [Terriglobia bacterium]
MNRREFITATVGCVTTVVTDAADGELSTRGGRRFSLDTPEQINHLPEENLQEAEPRQSEWLVVPVTRRTCVYRTGHPYEISMSNGLIRRSWRLRPNCATVAFDNLMTGSSILRAVKPEAYVKLNWQAETPIGGLTGQPNGAYLKPEWLDQMSADPRAFRCIGFNIGETRARFAWKRTRFSGNQLWPPPGVSIEFHYRDAETASASASVTVHYEMYDGIPLLSKWLTIHNGTTRRIRINTFTNEILAAVEYESSVNSGKWHSPNMHVESDYEFGGDITSESCNHTVHWVPDPDYTTQVNYKLETPCLLHVHPPLGPEVDIPPGGAFETYRTYELIYDSTERERNGLALRRMYRTIAPWITENPIFMHVTSAKPEAVRSAIDQAAEVGFEMVIISFGAEFDPENQDSEFIAQMKGLADYGIKKGVVLGGYSLLASRNISPEDDVINPKTGTIEGAIFGYSPCLGSRWGIEYFKKLRSFFEMTGIGALENDGSYPGDVCASLHHPGHRGLLDSQWTQWKEITDFYRWCRGHGIYLNVPDWYFLNGASKTGMGYRETDWSLPRAQQVIIARQNIFDGTWQKTPSMGWMFVPLVQYHGGGTAATIEPLRDHLHTYGQILAQNFGSGVQAAYRGYELFDTDETRAVIKKWVEFYQSHRPILESDIIHVRRADGRDIDVILHVNPQLREKGFAMIYNPLDVQIRRTLTLPLYYTGITRTARIREREGEARDYHVNDRNEVTVTLLLAPSALSWLSIE